MADPESVRQRIIASVFSKRNAAGVPEESYVSHVKIWENDTSEQGGQKPRYILISKASNGAGYIHKSKLNTNGTFSVGKTWKVPELRGLEVVDPLAFNITLARTYSWQTESQSDQETFLNALVRLHKDVMGGNVFLQLVGLTIPNDPQPSALRQENNNDRIPQNISTPPTNGAPSLRRPQVNQFASSTPSEDRNFSGLSRPLSPPLSSQNRSPVRSPGPARPVSPAGSSRNYQTSASKAPVPSSSPMSQASATRPRRARQLSSAASSVRSSSSTTGQVPSIVTPPLAPAPTRPPVNTSQLRPQASQIQSFSSSRPSLEVPSPTGTASTPLSMASTSPLSAYGMTDGQMSRNRNGDRVPSPAPSTSSRKSQTKSQASRGPSPIPVQFTPSQPRRDPNARISFFDPANQAVIDRLLSTDMQSIDGAEVEEESVTATMANIEEMLEGYEWASGDMMGRTKARGAADQIEARLLDELMALDKASIHSFLESDDRITTVLKYLDDAILELDGMDSLISSYKIHLNAVGDDISYIQSQNRGLQVQTQNQKALLNELEQLLQTVHVDRETLVTLTQESLEKSSSIERLEIAASELYKALLAGRDNDMAATMERLDEYRTYNAQFCKRMLDFLTIMFTAQSNILLGNNNGVTGYGDKSRPDIVNHQELESYLGRYSGLMLYLKEMDESKYSKVCAAYFSAASELHMKQMKTLFGAYSNQLKKISDDDADLAFGVTPTSATYRAAGGLRRAGTVSRSPLDGRKDKDKDKDKQAGGDLRTSEALYLALEQIAPQIYREQDFIADFLQINDAAFTFAEYMGLEHYFKRQASRSSGLSPTTMKLVRGAMDLIFGFAPAELKGWIDAALSKDNMQITGVIACLERHTVDAEERGNMFFAALLEKQHQRMIGLFDRHVDEQIKAIEHTKLTSKKRNGVAHFIKYFPVYVGRVEAQLIGADGLEIRASADAAYERIVQSMFDSLKQMAKLDGEGEDKGQLNYHVILIENMHYFIAEIGQRDIAAVNVFRNRAEGIYDENLNAYIKIILRRPFAKIIDYFEGVERLLKTTAPTEVSKNGSYNRSALKRVVKEYNAKDVRKHIDVLFKRVEKHFTEASDTPTTETSSGITPGTVLVGVWKACEDELRRFTDLFTKLIKQCYADTGVSLEYTVVDVEASFKRHRVGS